MTSHAGSVDRCARKDSLIRRLTRFRSTARLANLFAMTIPSRGDVPSLSRTKALSGASRTRNCACLNTRSNSDLRRRRQSREKRKITGQRGLAVLCRQALAPFGTPRVDHLAAAAGRHARPESMVALALNYTWLKGPLHVGPTGKRSAILWAAPEGVNLSCSAEHRLLMNFNKIQF